MSLLTQHYSDKISAQLSSYDRIIIQGTLPDICYAPNMTSFLYANGIRILDYPRFAEPLHNQLRDNPKKIARDHGLQIHFIRKIIFIVSPAITRRPTNSPVYSVPPMKYGSSEATCVHRCSTNQGS